MSSSIAPDLDRSTAARRVTLARPTRRPAEEPALDLDALVAIAQGLAQAEDLWRPHVSHDPLSRTSVRLVATEAYEVWLLGWTDGQRVELHDHGGANAAFVVLEGVLEEVTLGFAGTTTKRLVAGSVGTVPCGAVHDVVNTEPVVAASLHVYSNPLRTMTYYDGAGEATYTELVEQVPALLTAATQSRALHPARLDG
ncbi:cysteine dioxygenase [Aquihabitans daechungensis]|uniref:cysteine dioxygenase n=1 Tax=Aquihabitans daechungensis TaxID=1052257 RepID=UPI003BA2416F